jgi:hypothetical protein
MSRRSSATPTRGEASGGVLRTSRTAVTGSHHVYQAVCGKCGALGPPSVGSQRGARRLALAQGWSCAKHRVMRTMLETKMWIVRCGACAETTKAPG